MTVSDSITLPEKSVQFCAITGDFEVQVNGQIIGYAATELRGTQLANEHVYAVLSARGYLYADMTQDDADALLALHLADDAAMLDVALHAVMDVNGPILPITHPIIQLVREATWLLSDLPFAA